MPSKKTVTDDLAAESPAAVDAAPAKPARRRSTAKAETPAGPESTAVPAAAEAATAPKRAAKKAAPVAEAAPPAEAKAPKARSTRTAKAAAASAEGMDEAQAPAKKKPAAAAKPAAAKAKTSATRAKPAKAAASEVAETAVDAAAGEAVVVEVPAAAVPAPEPAVAVAAPAAESATPAAEIAAEITTPVVEAVAPAAEAEAPAEAAATAGKAEAVRRGRPRTPLESVVVGTALRGKVVGLRPFGVFVDIGAMTDGLVHITEFPKKGVRKVEDVVKNGDSVDVWVKDVDARANRISLTMRQPARHAIGSLNAGDVLTGTITSLTQYGAFVDIGSDTEGLVHVSEMSSGYVKKPDDIVHAGDVVEVRIKEIDRNRQRISLSMVGLANDTGLAAAEEEAARAKAEAGARAQAAADNAYVPEEPVERQPTVVELALRRALGHLDDDAAPAARQSGQKGGRKAAARDLGDVYTRMIAEYRSTKPSDK